MEQNVKMRRPSVKERLEGQQISKSNGETFYSSLHYELNKLKKYVDKAIKLKEIGGHKAAINDQDDKIFEVVGNEKTEEEDRQLRAKVIKEVSYEELQDLSANHSLLQDPERFLSSINSSEWTARY